MITSPEFSVSEGKLPPQNIDFEKLILGVSLIDGNGLEHVLKVIKDNDSVFYDPKNREIYRAIYTLSEKNDPVDFMTVLMQLKKTESLKKAGGDVYLIDLTTAVSSSAHTEYHCRIVWECYLKRKIIEAGNAMIDKAFQENTDVFDALDFTVSETSKIQNYLSGQKPIQSLLDVHKQFIEYAKQEAVPGVPMPFRKLQEENQGWQDSDLTIVAGRPGMGKTALALEFGRFAAKNDYPVHFFSLEMANIQLHKRVVANELQINANRIRKKQFSDNDLQKIFQSPDFERMPFYFDDSLFEWEEIKARARMVANEKKTKLIIIDYLQLISTKRKMSTIDRVTFVSRELKMLAKELNIPVMALSQLSRTVETRPGKRPQLSDLRESGAIEQDADIILFPYRPEYYGITKWEEETENVETDTEGKALLITAKNRHCGESELVIGWAPEYQKFHDLGAFEVFEEKEVLPQLSPADAFEEEIPF